MEERKTGFHFEARYHTAGTLNSTTRQVWVVMHGYGQLARYFLKKFEILAEQNVYIIAPEGLSRFYLSELTETGRPDNKVGATWMTQENRLMDIDNYIKYLDSVFQKEVQSYPNVPVTLLGFSQGCATVCRWAVEGTLKFERVILWAGLFPPDLDFVKGHTVLSAVKTYMVIGNDDPFLTSARIQEFDLLANQLGIQPEKITFQGKHEINEEVLRGFIK